MPRKNARPRCSYEGCDNPHHANGYCNTHYRRVLRRGEAGPAPIAHKRKYRMSDEKRFWRSVAKVDEDGKPWPKGCWEWTGDIDDRTGRGRFWPKDGEQGLGHGRTTSAARFAWEITHGPIPKGVWVTHSCRWWSCVNPEHLVLRTPKEVAARIRAEGWL